MIYRRAPLFRRLGTAVIGLALIAPHAAPLSAAMIGTGEVIHAEASRLDQGRLLEALDREDVQHQLVALGVSPEDARERVSRLTSEEIAALESRVAELPAGGDALALVAAIFIVLVVTDALGYTDIFSFVRPPR